MLVPQQEVDMNPEFDCHAGHANTRVDVLCVGHASYDLVFSVPQHPLPDEKSVAGSLIRCGGGPAANAAVAVSRLGYLSAFAGYLGEDEFGAIHLAELEGENVLVDHVVRGTGQTTLSVVLVKPDGQRSLVNYRAEGHPLPRGCIDFSNMRPKVILFDGHEPFLSAELVELFKGDGVKTVLDAGSLHEGTELLASKVDYLLCSEKFVRQFTGEMDKDRAIDKLLVHAPVVVITLGERGLLWKSPGDRGELPAHEVEAIDTTGAGDAFHGAFAACIAAGKDLDYTLRYASVVAAICCTKLGARPGLPTKREVDEFIRIRGIQV